MLCQVLYILKLKLSKRLIQAIDAVDINLQGQINTHESQIQDIVTAYIDNKGYFATLPSLEASHPPEIGDTAYVADALSSTGYYIYNVVDGIWTSSTVEAPPVAVPIGDYILKTNVKQDLGDSDTDIMSQKAVTDELGTKANHGYESNPKTLKEVEG